MISYFTFVLLLLLLSIVKWRLSTPNKVCDGDDDSSSRSITLRFTTVMISKK